MLAIAFFVLTNSAGSEGLHRAQEAFDAAEFEKAVPLFRAVLSPPQLSSAEARKARLELAEALFFTNQREAAKSELKLLLQHSPNARVDTKSASPDFVDFFNLVKQQQKPAVQKHREPRDEAPPPETVSPEPAPEVTAAPPPPPATTAPVNDTPTVEAKHYTAAPWYLKILPFGIGQFANHDTVGGAVFLSVEAAFLGGNIGISVYNAGQIQNGRYPSNGPYPAMYWLQVGTAVACYATAIIGIIDAFVWSPGRAAHKAALTFAPAVSDRAMALDLVGVF